MKPLVILSTCVFSFFLIDLRLFKNAQNSILLDAIPVDESSIDLSQLKVKQKRKIKRYQNRKYKKRKNYRYKKNLRYNSKPKCHRFSNQRSLRMMFRGSP